MRAEAHHQTRIGTITPFMPHRNRRTYSQSAATKTLRSILSTSHHDQDMGFGPIRKWRPARVPGLIDEISPKIRIRHTTIRIAEIQTTGARPGPSSTQHLQTYEQADSHWSFHLRSGMSIREPSRFTLNHFRRFWWAGYFRAKGYRWLPV